MSARAVVSSLLIAALALAAVAASPAEQFTVVGEEACVAGPDVEEGTTPDWADLCTLAFATDTDGPVPTVAVQLTTVGSAEERLAPVRWSVSWSAGSCDVTVSHADSVAGDDFDELVARCGEPDVRCDDLPAGDVPFDCTDEGSTFIDVPIARPTVTGNTVTWVLELSGDLSPVAASHGSGATITGAQAIGATSFSTRAPYDVITVRAGGILSEVCVAAVCSTPVDDLLVADREHAIG